MPSPAPRRPIDGSSLPPVTGEPVASQPGDAAYRATERPIPGDPVAQSDSAVLRAVAPPLPPEVEAAGPAARFGKFVRTAKLGQGGMGEVWKAWDVPLGRWVALKFLTGGDETEIARFTQEAHVAGRLSHPNITAVFEVGEAQGRHYIAMQYVEGTTAARLPRGDRRALARVVRDAARAVEEAHRHGVIHRDLKPDNLLVRGKHGSGSVAKSGGDLDDWHVFVTDFGLAKRTEGVSGLSLSGAVIGTPAYMSPEQSRGEAAGPGSDVYSLGATLYELLTGQPPFTGAGLFEVLKSVQEKEPVPPRQLNPAVEPDLDTIVLKCLEKDPVRRYATAEEFAADLDRWLEGDAIAARPASLVYRVRRKLRKKRALVLVGLLGLLGIGATLAVVLPKLFEESRAREAKELELQLWLRLAGILSDAEVLSRAGALEKAKEKLREGETICRETQAKHDFAMAHYFLGRILAEGGHHAPALAALDRALAMDPALGEARLARGVLLGTRYVMVSDQTQLRMNRENGLEMMDESSTAEDAETQNPVLLEMAAAIQRDLAGGFGSSSYYSEADRLYAQAILAFVQMAWPEARRLLESLVKVDPTYTEALLLLARIGNRRGDFEGALLLGRKGLDQHKGKLHLYVVLAQACERLAATRPYDAEVDAWRREGLEATGRALALGFRSPSLLDARGSLLVGLCRYAEAIEAFDAALAIDPAWDSALLNRGVARAGAGDFNGAIADYEAVLAGRPQSGMTRRNLGTARAQSGDREGAIRDFEAAIAQNARDAEAWYLKGLTLAELGRDAEAAAAYTRAIEAAPRHFMALNNRANLHYGRREFDSALADLDAAVKAQPRFPDAWFNRGNVLTSMERFPDAIASYDEALKLKPGWIEALYHRADAKLDAEDGAGAIPDYLEVLKARPGWADAHYNLGNAYASRGDLELAIRCYTDAIAADEKHAAAFSNRGTAYFLRGKTDEAIADFGRQIELEPGKPEGYLSRGQAYLKKNSKKRATADFEEALKLLPEGHARRAEVEQFLKVLKK